MSKIKLLSIVFLVLFASPRQTYAQEKESLPQHLLDKEIQVNFIRGTPATEVFSQIAKVTSMPVVGFLGTPPTQQLTIPIQRGTLHSVLDRVSVDLGLSWIIQDQRLIFSRIAAPEKQREQAQRTLKFWLSLPEWSRVSLLNERVIRLSQLPAASQEAYTAAFGNQWQNITDKAWAGLSLIYDLNVIFSHTDPQVEPVIDRAIATPWEKVGVPLGVVVPEKNNDATAYKSFIGSDANPFRVTSAERPTPNSLNVILPDEVKNKIVGNLGKSVWSLSAIAAELTRRSGQQLAVEKTWADAQIWVDFPQETTLTQAIQALTLASQMQLRQVGALVFLRPLDEKTALPATDRQDDLKWLSQFLGSSVQDSELSELKVPFAAKMWINTSYFEVNQITTQQKEWLRTTARGMRAGPLAWGSDYDNDLLSRPQTVAFRLVPRFTFRIGQYEQFRIGDKPVEAATETSYQQADTMEWMWPVFRRSEANTVKQPLVSEAQLAQWRRIVLESTRSEDEALRREAVFALAGVGNRNESGILERLIFDKNEEVALISSAQIISLGYPEYLPFYRQKLADANPVQRLEAIALLGDQTQLGFAKDSLSDTNPQIRAAAATALGSLGNKTTLAELEKLSQTDVSPLVRATADGAILLLTEAVTGQQVLKISQWLDDPAAPIRQQVAKILYLYSSPTHPRSATEFLIWEVLWDHQDDEDPDVRSWIRRSLARLGVRSFLERTIKNIPDTPGPKQVESAAAALVGWKSNQSRSDPEAQMSPQGLVAWARAGDIAGEGKQGLVLPEHLLLGILRAPKSTAVKVLEHNGINLNDLATALRSAMAEEKYQVALAQERDQSDFMSQRFGEKWWQKGLAIGSKDFTHLTGKMRESADRQGLPRLTTAVMLSVLAENENAPAGKILRQNGVTPKLISSTIHTMRFDTADAF